MLTPQDDLIGHQAPTSFAHTVTSDPAWMERFWYTGHRIPDGGIMLDIGLGYHPNRGVMDAHAGVTIGTVQHNVRVSRRLGADPLSTELGPLRIAVLEGMKRHRLTLQENESGLSFDLEFLATTNCHEEEHHFRRRLLRVSEDMARYQQAGRYSGWMKVDGKRHEVAFERWWGQRDHSWGVRSDFVTDEKSAPLTRFPPFMFVWLIGQFQRGAVHLFANERAPGDYIYLSGERVSALGTPTVRGKRIVRFDHDFTWSESDILGQTAASAVFEFHCEDGTSEQAHVRMLPARYFLKGGLYGGLNGWRHGDDKGKLHIEHDRWDLTDKHTRSITRALADCTVEIRMGGEVGYGVCEYGVTSGYPKYEAVQINPAP